MDATSTATASDAAFSFSLNGETVVISGVSPNVTLLDWLRANGRPGTKQGCAEGDCGACTVAWVERDAAGQPTYRAINSCLVLLPMCAGREIVSVEGLATGGRLHPVQKCLVTCHGSQCGYCTPGFVMSAFEGYHRADLRERWQIDDQLAGNLCRCTGYRPIRDAASRAFAKRAFQPADPHVARLASAPVELGSLDYGASGQRFLRPTSLAGAFALLERFPDARLIAGGTELSLLVTKKFQSFGLLISLEAVPELREVAITAETVRLGGGLTLTQLEEILAGGALPELARPQSALRNFLRWFGSRQIRSRATIGGNLCTASPIGDLAPVFLALDASVVLASATGERTVPLADFFVAYRKTLLQPGEIMRAVVFPRFDPVRRLVRSFKVSRRREMDISTVSAVCGLELEAANRVTHVRLAFGGVAAMPQRARRTEAWLVGREWNAATVAEARRMLETEFTPLTDVRGGAAYRSGLIGDLFEKFFHGGPEAEAELDAGAIENVNPWPGEEEWPLPHESAVGHVTGRARYVDDQSPKAGMLEVWPVGSPHAHARILRRDATRARALPGIRAVLLAEDIPGMNDVGAVRHDEILLADREVSYHGHLVALVVGETAAQCRAAAALVEVEYEPLPAILSVAEAVAQGSFHTDHHQIVRGDVSAALPGRQTLSGEFFLGGQEHFYLETQSAWAEPGEEPGEMFVHSSTQHPAEIQTVVAHVLGIAKHHVIVQSPRMGGGFGGKETQGNTFAALAALAAHHTGEAVRVWLNRDQDMMLTGKRHPFLARFEVGFDSDGRLHALRAELFADGGWSLDLSTAICDRALLHLDNAYYLPHVEVRGRVAKTHVASNTAFRGFGGPQGMLVIEEIIDRVARTLGLPPEVVRERNLYHGEGATNTTHYGQAVGDERIGRIWRELGETSDFAARRAALAEWNAKSPRVKRGLAVTPVKFGISFTLKHLNQAGALVLIYQDGSVQLNHGGTEMGQGLHTKILGVAQRELGVTRKQLRVMPTRTDKVPNTSPTAASSGSDLNGAAIREACRELRRRLHPVAARLLKAPAEAEIVIAEGRVSGRGQPEASVSWEELIAAAYFDRVPLSATGFYATPGIAMDWSVGQGTPFYYFACGAAVSEVEVDGFTGAHQLRRVDILHDVGASLAPGIDRGQIEGGYIQGVGWLTAEELKWDAEGRLLTHSPDTYKVPAIGDVPVDFRVAFLRDAAQAGVVGGSKAVGEPPLMLAISAREAIRDAVAAFGGSGPVELASPATGEAIWHAIQKRKK